MIKLTEEQHIAMKQLLDFCKGFTGGNIIQLRGSAGTGKSVLLSKLSEALDGDATVLTPTGKATDILMKKGVDSATIHSFIYTPIIVGNKVIGYRRSDKYSNIIIIDEASMLDKKLLNDLKDSCDKLILIGDPAQLPPIGGLIEIPESKIITLTEIHRQAKGNPIIRLATMFRDKRRPTGFGTSKSDSGSIIVKKYDGNFYMYDGVDVVICGRNKTKDFVNRIYREHNGITGYLPVTGEKLMALNNLKEIGIYNGKTLVVERVGKPYSVGRNDLIDIEVLDDLGGKLPVITTFVDTFKKKIFKKGDIEFDGIGLPYAEAKELRKSIVYLDFSYAITAHKSQGSTYGNVLVLGYDNWMQNDDWFKWMYTSVTRASTNLIVEM